VNAPVIFIDPARFPAVAALQLCGACLFWPEKLLNILGLWHEQRWHYARLARVAHNAWRFGAKVIVLKII